MSRICFAILAHSNRDCLEDLIRNLEAFSPGCAILLFNGGLDTAFYRGLGIEVCPYSQPLRWGKIEPFQLGIFQWIAERGYEFDYLVTLDSDMMLLKPGLDAWLDARMGASSYMAVNFAEIPPDTHFKSRKRYWIKWKRIWQPILKTRYPYYCLNPGQVFRRQYVERLLRFEGLPELRVRMARSRVPILEEMIYPTLAAALDCEPMAHPVGGGYDTGPVRVKGRHTVSEIQAYLAHPDIFFIHPVPLRIDAPERKILRRLAAGERLDFEEARREFEPYEDLPKKQSRFPVPVPVPIRSALKDLYLRLMPE